MHELRLEPAGWIHADLSTTVIDLPPAPAAATSPFAYITPADQVPRVLYTGWIG
jgi:hypothetical protein